MTRLSCSFALVMGTMLGFAGTSQAGDVEQVLRELARLQSANRQPQVRVVPVGQLQHRVVAQPDYGHPDHGLQAAPGYGAQPDYVPPHVQPGYVQPNPGYVAPTPPVCEHRPVPQYTWQQVTEFEYDQVVKTVPVTTYDCHGHPRTTYKQVVTTVKVPVTRWVQVPVRQHY